MGFGKMPKIDIRMKASKTKRENQKKFNANIKRSRR